MSPLVMLLSGTAFFSCALINSGGHGHLAKFVSPEIVAWVAGVGIAIGTATMVSVAEV